MNVRQKAARLGGVALLAPALVAAGGNEPGVAAPPQDRSCPVTNLPNPLPDVAAVVEVEPLRGALAMELAGSSGAAPMLFSARFAADGRREWLERIGGEGADTERQQRVQRIIVEHMKAQPSGRMPWSVRLQVTPGDSIGLGVSHSEVCPVERIEQRSTGAAGSFPPLTRADMREMERAGPVTVAVDVSATGNVVGVDLLRRSGSRLIDDAVLKEARYARYRPAIIDGRPVAGRYEWNSRTRVRPGSRRTM